MSILSLKKNNEISEADNRYGLKTEKTYEEKRFINNIKEGTHLYKKIGVSISENLTLEQFAVALETLSKFDIGYIEVTPELGPVIIGGRLNPHYLKEIKSIMSNYPFEYTVHCPNMQNMRDVGNIAMQHDIFKSGLEFTKEIGGDIYVAHFSKQSEDESIEKVFEEGMAEMAEHAEKIGVIIGIENIEIERIEPVVALIKSINMKNLRMTYDFAHSFLASKYYGYDFLESIKLAKHYLVHTHIHDNLGIFDLDRLVSRQKSLRYRLTEGKGDLHLPVGWGCIPYNEVFEITKDSYTGIYMLENDVGLSEKLIQGTLDKLKEYIE